MVVMLRVCLSMLWESVGAVALQTLDSSLTQDVVGRQRISSS